MDIKGKIKGIKYGAFLSKELPCYNMEKFNINEVTPCCIVIDSQRSFAVSKWVSPKLSFTSPKIIGTISSKSSAKERADFIDGNHFSSAQSVLIETLFKEAKENRFTVKISYIK